MISYSYLKGVQRSVVGILSYLASKHGEEVTGYYEERTAPSEWLGTGAEELGLSGPVDRAALAKLLAGHLPNGMDISQRGNRSGSRRLGCDLTISAPKSVSIMALVCGDERLLAAHDAAVREAARAIERRMMTARLGARGRMIEHTGWMVAAAYRHEDSRPIDGVADPQLHTHVVVANVTKRTDGVWAATDLDFGVRNETLYALDAVYKSALAKRVAELGYAIGKTRDGFEIGGLSTGALAAFSRRTAEIDRALAKEGLDREGATAAQRVRANVATRLEKEHPGEVAQRYAWRERAREADLDLEGGLRPLPRERPSPEGGSLERAAAEAATESAARHLGERASVFSEAELLRDALLSSLGAAGPESVAQAIEARCGGLVAGTDRRRGQVFTTEAALASEQRVLEIVRSGREATRAVAEPEAVERRLAREQREGLMLTPGQHAAVHLALETKDRHVGIVGAAGAGKTRALGTIVAMAREAGYEVVGLAPSAVAARALRQAGCERTETLEAGLRQPMTEPDDATRRDRPRFYVLDEAGMVSARDMDRLLQRAEAGGARTLLVGDPRQLASVEAGSPFQQMLEAGALRHVRMDEVLRQHDPALRKIAQRFARGDAEGAVQAAQPYMVAVEKPQLATAAAAAYLAKTPEERAETLVLAGTNRTRSAVNEKIRTGLRERGELDRDELVLRALDKADLTREQARRAPSYEPGMVVVFTRAAKDGRHVKAARGSQWEVIGHDNEHVRLRPLGAVGGAASGGEEIIWRPSGEGARAYRARAMALAQNERIVFRENDHARGITNGMGGVVVGLEHGEAVVRTEAGQELRLNASQAEAVDYGYCRTVHASQGATVERVIVVGEASRVATAQTAYVAASRERSALTILTDDRERLAEAWAHWAERETARQLLTHTIARVQAAAEAKGLANEIGRERSRAAARAQQAREQKREAIRQQEREAARERLREELARQRAQRQHRGPSLGM